MKKFFREHGIWVLFATAVISVALALMSFFSNTSSPLSNLAGIIASPFRSAYTAVADWITDKQNYYQDVTALEEENAALKRENAILRAKNRLAETNNEENARFRQPAHPFFPTLGDAFIHLLYIKKVCHPLLPQIPVRTQRGASHPVYKQSRYRLHTCHLEQLLPRISCQQESHASRIRFPRQSAAQKEKKRFPFINHW